MHFPFFTEVLPEEVLAAKLHEAIEHAQERLASREEPKRIWQDS